MTGAAAALARRSDPATSREAARSVDVDSQEVRVTTILIEATRPMTDEEIWREHLRREVRNDWPPATQAGLRSRRSELERRGIVTVVDERGRTSAGRRCRRWRFVPASERSQIQAALW